MIAHAPVEFRFRDYQIAAIVNVFVLLGVDPAGPADDPIVAAWRNRKAQENVECPF